MHLLALALASPWLLAPLITVWRARGSPSLDDESPVAAPDARRVSVVIPARNEALNIERCVRSLLASTWPHLEVIAVDDHSTDATGRILAELAHEDSRLRVVTPPALPPGWFGKQWACAAGMAESTGSIVGFMDADTWQSADLVTRVVNAMRSHDAEFLSVAGKQALGSFWERLIQPQVFSMLLLRYGGPAVVNASPRKSDKIANGQCIFVRRETHDSVGGHGAVRDRVAEDLALAQLYFTSGKRARIVLGLEQLSTRMYTSFAEINRGWGKNIYAGGLDAWPSGWLWRALYPMALLAPSGVQLVAAVLAIFGVLGLVPAGLFVWSAAVSLVYLLWWSFAYASVGESPLYALLYPLGAGALLYISVGAIVRGRRVQWKGREYVVS